MPRRQRYIEVGFHHIISRGVERRNVFLDDTCFDKFFSLMYDVSVEFNIAIHAFCLMSNHYHILLQTNEENLSEAVKKLNSHYASWFNKTYERSGHLWQGRYKSYFVYNDNYFWTVAKYIERNPVAANVAKDISTYPHQSFYLRLHKHHPHSKVISNSKILEMPLEDYTAFLSGELSSEFRKNVYNNPRPNKNSERVYLEKPISFFFEADGARNEKICECYEYGYTKTAIAEYLGLSKTAIAKILK